MDLELTLGGRCDYHVRTRRGCHVEVAAIDRVSRVIPEYSTRSSAMANWMVSGHGSIEHKKANKILNRIQSEASFLTVPTGIEIVFYCPDDIGLSMAGGWKLWDMLMYGEHGGEQAAYAAKYKKFKAGSTVTNFYVCIDPTDYNHWDDGPHRAAGHALINAYGVWKVGDASAPVIDFTLLPNYVTRLSNIVGQAI